MLIQDKSSTLYSTPEEIFRKLYPRLCDFSFFMLKDKDIAEDTVQDAFTVYLEKRENISADFNAIKSFLYSSVKNACLNRIKHMSVVEVYNKKNPLNVFSDPEILEGMINAEIIAEIHDKINTLPKGCSLVIRYGYLEGLSNAEIAELMGISINTVKSQKKRGLDLMKERLGKLPLLFFLLLFVNR